MLENTPSGIDIVAGHPGTLNRMMAKGDLAMSPISTAAFADIHDEVLLLPDFCLASIGYVRSVMLLSKLPIEALDGKTIGLSSASETSVALLKTLLAAFYGIAPNYVTSAPYPRLDDLDAALVIGNEALYPEKQAVPYTYDLGDLWLRKTGYPVVFAVFAVRKDALEPFAAEIRSIIAAYSESQDKMQTEKERMIAKARERYPDIAYDIYTYYTLLRYEFSGLLKKAMRFFLDKAAEGGFVRPTATIRFLPDEFSLANIREDGTPSQR